MAWHPQTDGQTERVNQELDQYLRLFVNERQDDWYDLLPLAEFQHNNHIHSATQHPLFLLDTGRLTPAPVFNPGDKVFLDTSDIRTTRPSQKLSHRRLGPFIVERWIGPMAYRLKLPHWMKQLHPVFNVVKLTPAPDDPIPGRKTTDHPPPIIIDGEAEWEVEKILDSRWHQKRFQYLVK